jgi:hypothetical protein
VETALRPDALAIVRSNDNVRHCVRGLDRKRLVGLDG